MQHFTFYLDEPDQPQTGRASFTFPTGIPVWSIGTIDEWTIALMFISRDGVPILSELRVFPTESKSPGGPTPTEWSGEVDAVPGNGIPATLVKNIALGRIENQIRQAFADHDHPEWPGSRDWYEGEPPDHYLEWLSTMTRTSINPKRTASPHQPGRPQLSDEHLATVALHYTFALAKGIPITSHIQEQMQEGSEHLPITSWVDKARRREFLTRPPKPGRPGGDLTDKARAVLERLEHKFTSPSTPTNQGDTS